MHNKNMDFIWKIIYVLILKILITAVLTVVPTSFILFKSFSGTSEFAFSISDLNKIISNKALTQGAVVIANLVSFVLTPIVVEGFKWNRPVETAKNHIKLKISWIQVILGIATGAILFILVLLINNIKLKEIYSWPIGHVDTYIIMLIFIIYIYFEERFYRIYFSYLLDNHGEIPYPVISNGFFVFMVYNQTGRGLVTLLNICLLSAVLYLAFRIFKSITIGASFRASYTILSFLLISSHANDNISAQDNGIATGIIDSNAVTIGLVVYITICLLFIWWKRTVGGEADENKQTLSKIS